MFCSLNSHCRSAANPLRTRQAFHQYVLASDEIAPQSVPAVDGRSGNGDSAEADQTSAKILLRALCLFCDMPPTSKSRQLDSDCCQSELHQARTCPKCGMELLMLEWAEVFFAGRLQAGHCKAPNLGPTPAPSRRMPQQGTSSCRGLSKRGDSLLRPQLCASSGLGLL